MKLESRETASDRFAKAARDEKALRELGRFRALQAVARVGGAGAADVLKSFLQDKNSDMAACAADGLGTLGDLAQADVLIASLGTKDEEVKPAVCEALERLTGKNHRFDLIKWNEWQTEQKAVREKKPVSPSDPPPPYENGYDVEKEPWNDRPVDLVIVYDTTRSLYKIWPQMSAAIDAVLAQLTKQVPALRIGTVKYRAADPERTTRYMIEPKPITRNLQSMRDDILDASFGGGSGGLHLGLSYALSSMCWRASARKVVLVVGDTTPEASGLRTCMQLIGEVWQMDSVLVHTLYVQSAHGDEHVASYRYMAQAGMGRFYQYNKAEKHVVDMSAEKVDVRETELPAVTSGKWITPREKK